MTRCRLASINLPGPSLPKRSVIDFLGDICRLYCVLPVHWAEPRRALAFTMTGSLSSVPQTNPIDITKRTQGYPTKVTDGRHGRSYSRWLRTAIWTLRWIQRMGGFAVRRKSMAARTKSKEVSVAFCPHMDIHRRGRRPHLHHAATERAGNTRNLSRQSVKD